MRLPAPRSAFGRNGARLYLSNLALYLPYAGAGPAIDSAWTLEVEGYTVAELPARIPPLAGDNR